MTRTEILRAYIARQRDAIKHLSMIHELIAPEFYLARAASMLIWLHENRIACEKQGRGRYASDKKIMAMVLQNKRIGSGTVPFATPLMIHLGGKVVEITHVRRAA